MARRRGIDDVADHEAALLHHDGGAVIARGAGRGLGLLRARRRGAGHLDAVAGGVGLVFLPLLGGGGQRPGERGEDDHQGEGEGASGHKGDSVWALPVVRGGAKDPSDRRCARVLIMAQGRHWGPCAVRRLNGSFAVLGMTTRCVTWWCW